MVKFTPITSKPVNSGNHSHREKPFIAFSAGNYLYAINSNAVYRWQSNAFEEILNEANFPQVKTVTGLGNRIYLDTLRVDS
jgi:hypothetical protein